MIFVINSKDNKYKKCWVGNGLNAHYCFTYCKLYHNKK